MKINRLAVLTFVYDMELLVVKQNMKNKQKLKMCLPGTEEYRCWNADIKKSRYIKLVLFE